MYHPLSLIVVADRQFVAAPRSRADDFLLLGVKAQAAVFRHELQIQHGLAFQEITTDAERHFIRLIASDEARLEILGEHRVGDRVEQHSLEMRLPPDLGRGGLADRKVAQHATQQLAAVGCRDRAEKHLQGNCYAILATHAQFATRRGSGRSAAAGRRGQQRSDLLAHELRPPVTQQRLHLPVDQRDLPRGIGEHQRVWQRFDQAAEAFLIRGGLAEFLLHRFAHPIQGPGQRPEFVVARYQHPPKKAVTPHVGGGRGEFQDRGDDLAVENDECERDRDHCGEEQPGFDPRERGRLGAESLHFRAGALIDHDLHITN